MNTNNSFAICYDICENWNIRNGHLQTSVNYYHNCVRSNFIPLSHHSHSGITAGVFLSLVAETGGACSAVQEGKHLWPEKALSHLPVPLQ